MASDDVGDRITRSGAIDELIGVTPASRGEAVALEEGFLSWVAEDGEADHQGAATASGTRQVVVGAWHVRLSSLRWNVLTLVPLLALNVVVHRGVSPSDVHGVLTALESATRRLSPREWLVVRRVQEQGRAFDGAAPDSLGTGLSEDDRAALADVIETLIDGGVLRRDEDGLLQVTL